VSSWVKWVSSRIQEAYVWLSMLSVKMKMVNLWLRHKVNHIFKWQIDDNKWENKPHTVINTKIIIMFFSNVSKRSPNYLGKPLKLVLFECWFLFVFETKVNAQSSKLLYKISPKLTSSGKFQRKIFKRNDWEVNELCLSQMLLAREDIIKGKKYNEVWWEIEKAVKMKNRGTGKLRIVLAGIHL